MPVYSCSNCSNLKNRVITKEHISAIKGDKISRALKEHNPDSLGLDFPFNMTVYKRVLKDGECPIIYCSQRMFNRDLYIHRENLDISSVYPSQDKPCPKYK